MTAEFEPEITSRSDIKVRDRFIINHISYIDFDIFGWFNFRQNPHPGFHVSQA